MSQPDQRSTMLAELMKRFQRNRQQFQQINQPTSAAAFDPGVGRRNPMSPLKLFLQGQFGTDGSTFANQMKERLRAQIMNQFNGTANIPGPRQR